MIPRYLVSCLASPSTCINPKVPKVFFFIASLHVGPFRVYAGAILSGVNLLIASPLDEPIVSSSKRGTHAGPEPINPMVVGKLSGRYSTAKAAGRI